MLINHLAMCNLPSNKLSMHCFSFQNFKATLQIMREAFFKHGDKDALRSCVKAFKFCATESQGELQDFGQNQVKELEDEIIAKLKSALKDVVV